MLKNLNESHFIYDFINHLFKYFDHYVNFIFSNFDKFILCSEDKKSMSLIVSKLSSIIEEENKNDFALVIKYIDKILQLIVKHESLIQLFNLKFHKFEEHLMDSSLNELILFFKSLKISSILFENSELTSKIYNFIVILLKDQNQEKDLKLINNYKTKKSAIKVLPLILKYSYRSNREEIIKWLESEIVQNSSYFKRRLFLTFFKSSCKLLSVNFLKELGIISIALNFFSDLDIVLPRLIKTLNSIFPIIYDDIKLKETIIMYIKGLKTKDKETLLYVSKFNKILTQITGSHIIFSLIFDAEAEKIKSEKIIQAKEAMLLPIKEDKKGKKSFSKKAANKPVLKVNYQVPRKESSGAKETLVTEINTKTQRKNSFLYVRKEQSVEKKNGGKDTMGDIFSEKNKTQNTNGLIPHLNGSRVVKTVITVKDSSVRKKR